MRVIENALRNLASSDRTLIEVMAPGGTVARRFTYREVTRAAQALSGRLGGFNANATKPLRVGVVCGNTPAFVVADLACLIGSVVEVPIPLAFSRAQAASLLGEVVVCLVDEEGEKRLAEWGRDVLAPGSAVVRVELDELMAAGLGASSSFYLPPRDGDWVCKIIHTSGTTSRPKGVQIRAFGLDALLCSLRDEMPDGAFRRYLSTVPMSLLIEQVTGLYMVLLHGGALVLLPSDVPLVGTAIAASSRVMPFLAAAHPTALVATPALVDQLRQAATAAYSAGRSVAASLFGADVVPLICCGGAPIDMEVLTSLDDMGIPVYEGYGLSENGSVVTWNRPGARRMGTVGKPLPHVQVRIADDGELLVKSTSLFAGYTTDDPSSCVIDGDGWLHTGDLGEIDTDGYVRLTGRKKNVIITSAGRNIAPEWVEAQYATLPFVRAVAVVGNHLPALHGLFLVDPEKDLDQARAEICGFGAANLSDIERVEVAYVIHGREEVYQRYFTVTGRPTRTVIERAITNGELESGAPKRDGYRVPKNNIREMNMLARQTSTTDVSGLEIRPYGRGAGMIIANRGGLRLSDLDPRWILKQLAVGGHLLFQGFPSDLETFSEFVKAHSSRVTLDPARSFHGGKVAQKVDAGEAAMGLHLENGNSPFRPDLTWFFCEKAASKGSQTTVCDGYRVWDRASESARRQFQEQDIVYHRRVDEQKWKFFVYHHIAGATPMEEIRIEHLLALVNEQRSTTITAEPDGSIRYSFRTPAAHPTLFGSQLAWANSIFGPSYNYEAPRILFADGRDLPAELVAEMHALTSELTEDIDWQDGDIALIDNTRVMHGRRAIEDRSRKIYNAQSYVNRALI